MSAARVVKIRDLFPIFSHTPWIYFDSAATTQKPSAVIDAMTHFLQREYGTVHRALYALSAEATQKYNAVREKVRQFIGAASTEEIIFTKGTTEAINIVARSFGEKYLEEGDEILVVETEHHSNLIPWQMVCRSKKAILRPIPVNDRGEIDMHVLQGMLSSRVKLIAVAHVSNATGAVHPIAEIASMAHLHGVQVFVDGAQSVSHFPICVTDIDIDFFVFSGHKMYGPTGIGVLYGKKKWLEEMPPLLGGGDMVENVSFEQTTYQPLPLKFEAGTPAITEVIGLGAAIDFLWEMGMDNILQREQELVEYALERLSAMEHIALLCNPTHRGSLISFNPKGCHSMDVGTLLDVQGIAVRTGHLCAQTALRRFGQTSTVRVSFGVYNTCEEVDLFLLALDKVIKTLHI